MKLSNLNITTRLVAAFGLLAALLLAVVAAAIVNMGAMSGATHELTDNWMPSVDKVRDMDTSFTDLRLHSLKLVTNGEEASTAAIEAQVKKAREDFAAARKAYESLISSDEERALVTAYDAAIKAYFETNDKILALARKNEHDMARMLTEKEAGPLGSKADELSAKLIDLNEAGARNNAGRGRAGGGAGRAPTAWPPPARRSPRATRPEPAHRRAGQRAAADRGLDGAAGQHRASQNADNARQANQLAARRGRWRARRRGGGPGGADHAGHQRQQRADRRHHRHHRRHRLPDQHPGAERRGGSRARRRTGPRLCRGGRRGAQPGAAQRRSRARDQEPDRRQRRAGGARAPSWWTRPAAPCSEIVAASARVRHRGRDQPPARAERRRGPGRPGRHARWTR
jgi:hypothetical protein